VVEQDRREPEQDLNSWPWADPGPSLTSPERLLQLVAGFVQPPLRGVDSTSSRVAQGAQWRVAETDITPGHDFSGRARKLLGFCEPSFLDRDQGLDGEGERAHHRDGRIAQQRLLRLRGRSFEAPQR
jgi:hypothetical protein